MVRLVRLCVEISNDLKHKSEEMTRVIHKLLQGRMSCRRRNKTCFYIIKYNIKVRRACAIHYHILPNLGG